MIRVFISSVIRGFQSIREAAADAIESLGYTEVRAENLGARDETPRRACLREVRESDATILLLGERYGEPQDSGLSATHEEFLEARAHGPVLVFVQEDITPEPPQAELIEEAMDWDSGGMVETFSDAADLRRRVLRRLHEYAVRSQAGGVDPTELTERARSLLPERSHRRSDRLHVVIAGGPTREVLPPTRLEDEALATTMIQQALFGPHPVFSPTQGTERSTDADGLLLQQEDRSVLLTEQGSVRIAVPPVRSDEAMQHGLPVLIEEDVRETLTTALGFGSWLLDEVDSIRRLAEVVILVGLESRGTLAWRTRREHEASPHRVNPSLSSDTLLLVPEDPPARPRAALATSSSAIAEDLLTRLRRQAQS